MVEQPGRRVTLAFPRVSHTLDMKARPTFDVWGPNAPLPELSHEVRLYLEQQKQLLFKK